MFSTNDASGPERPKYTEELCYSFLGARERTGQGVKFNTQEGYGLSGTFCLLLIKTRPNEENVCSAALSIAASDSLVLATNKKSSRYLINLV